MSDKQNDFKIPERRQLIYLIIGINIGHNTPQPPLPQKIFRQAGVICGFYRDFISILSISKKFNFIGEFFH
ncbi:hypothetical protein [uncultured Cohaesibacter sp.]|uniref:hypothetical protein n=1 Tax=uncultured Cohaesibacter sp. TaxID=1002546 RepID=UPI00292EADFC|nr:hypothetical protein [uncultured Cohaesibacter sp.]